MSTPNIRPNQANSAPQPKAPAGLPASVVGKAPAGTPAGFDSWETQPGAKLIKIDPASDYCTVKLGGSNGDLSNIEWNYGSASMSDADKKAWHQAIVKANGSFKLKLDGFLAHFGIHRTIKLPMPPNSQDSGVFAAVLANKFNGDKTHAAPGIGGMGGGFDAKGHLIDGSMGFSNPDDIKQSRGSYYVAPGSQPNTYVMMTIEQAKKLYPKEWDRLNIFGGA